MKILRLILGDQLNSTHSWFMNVDENILYIMMEVRQETDYIKHHIQKVAAFFASMREFAKELEGKGHNVLYLKLDDPDNLQQIPENLNLLIKKENIQKFEYLLPDEFRLDQQLKYFCKSLSISTKVFDTEHFLTERLEVKEFFENKKQIVMEPFYRHMRKKYNVLVDNGKPIGSKWNYDFKNRNRYDGKIPVPKPIVFKNDVSDILKLLRKSNVKTFGGI